MSGRAQSDGDSKPAAPSTKLATSSANPTMVSLAEKYGELISTDAEAEALKFLLAHPANQPKPQSAAAKPNDEADRSKQIEEAYQLHADLYGDASAVALLKQNKRKALGISEPDEPDRKQSKLGLSPFGQPYASFLGSNGLRPTFGPSPYSHGKDMNVRRELLRVELHRQEMESLLRLEIHRREVEETRMAAQIELKRRADLERRISMMEEEVQRAERERLVAASILSNLTRIPSSEDSRGSMPNGRA